MILFPICPFDHTIWQLLHGLAAVSVTLWPGHKSVGPLALNMGAVGGGSDLDGYAFERRVTVQIQPATADQG